MKRIYSGEKSETNANKKGNQNTSAIKHNGVIVAEKEAPQAPQAAAPQKRILSEQERHANPVVLWNTIAVDTSGIDHTFARKDQGGPCRSSRAMAIVHLALMDAVALITKKFKTYLSYTVAERVTKPTSINAAIGQAAFDTLLALFPQQKDRLTGLFADFKKSLSLLPDQDVQQRGYALGGLTAAKILNARKNDGSELPEQNWGTGPDDYKLSNDGKGFYGEWSQDPVSKGKVALGSRWNLVKPFVISKADQFRNPPFPSFDSPEYGAAFEQVKRLGGDGVTTPTERTEDQTEIGIFWAYDGMPSLCAPPRLYNYVALHIAKQKDTPMVDLARLLALVNTAMADNAIACWDSKYFYRIWRPVTGIPQASTAPKLLGSSPQTAYGSAATAPDATWLPLGAPASNGTGPNFTPPFPSYPSGHGTFGGALFQTLRTFFGTDDIPFTFVSDEYNGVTVDNQGNVRPLKPRSYKNLEEAELENAESRVYLGIHWQQDADAGIVMGRQVANAVFPALYRPL